MTAKRMLAQLRAVAMILALAAALDAQQTAAPKSAAPPSQPASAEMQPAAPRDAAPQQPRPLTVGGKLRYGMEKGFGPGSIVTSFLAAGYQQAFNHNEGFGQGAEGYFNRAGSNYGNNAIKGVVGSFALASIFHQDPRYFRSGHSSFARRLGHAVSRVLVARGDNGQAQFNISKVGGAVSAGLISTRWYQPPDDTVGRGFGRAGVSLAVSAVTNVLREFWPDIRRKLHH